MSKRKTEEQINAEIAALVALKPKVRQRTAFGDDNHAAIDALLLVAEKQEAALREAIATLERDGDEWGICDRLRAALLKPGPNVGGEPETTARTNL